MSTVTVPGPLQSLLANLTERVAVRDEAGNLLGFFTPRQVEEEILYERAKREFDPEEMRHRMADRSREYTFEEVMRHLESLEPR
jgi:hypothetical protein